LRNRADVWSVKPEAGDASFPRSRASPERVLREHLTNPRDFDGWLKANVFVGSIVAVAVLTMALAALYSGGGSNQIELSSVDPVSSASH